MEHTIHEEQARLADFLENAPIGFYSVGEDGRFVFVNRTFAAWLGYRAGEIATSGLRLHDFLEGRPEPDMPAWRPAPGEIEPESGIGGYEVMLRARDGRAIQVHIGQTEVGDADGAVRTDRKRGGQGKRVSGRGDLGGSQIIKKNRSRTA